MIIKYLLKALSALVNQFSLSDGTDFRDETNASAPDRDGINYLNVSPISGWLPRRRKRTFDLFPKSIIMATFCLLTFVVPLEALGATAPTTQATNVAFSAISGTGATISWTNGNGARRAVFVLAGSAGTPAPVNNTTYTANTTFGSGTQIGATGWYCVYANTGNNVTISGLNPGTTYRVMVVEYNTGGGAPTPAYQTATNATNPANFTTLPTLSNLVLSSGALTPAFATTTITYTQNVPFATSSVTVTPTLRTPGNVGSTITVNGTAVASGVASGSIALNVGSNVITTVVTAGDGVTTDTYTVTITRAAPTLSYTGSPYTYVTGFAITALNPTATATPTGYSISPGLPSGLSFDTSTGIISGTPSATSSATIYTVTANYSGGETATTTINIQVNATSTLTITATNITQTYGSVDVSGVSFTYSGFVGTDDASSMIVVPSISTTATSSSGAGTYPITVGGGQAPAYYTIVYVQGTFTINKANLNIVATGPPKAAGATVTSPISSTAYFTASGLIGSETITSVTLTYSNAGSQAAGAAYSVTPSAAVGANGFSTANYNITYTLYNGQCGQNYTWTGTTNTTWSTTTNWSPNGLPGTNDNVFIPATTTKPTVTASTNINTITFTGTSTLTVNTGVNILFYNGFTVSSGVTATLNMVSTSSQIQVGNNTSHAIMDNLGTLTVNGGIVFINYGLNYIYNETNAVMTFHGGNTLNIGGTSGQFAFQNNGFFFAGTSNSACTLNIVNSQSFINGATGNFYLGSTSSINFLDATAHDSHFSNTLGGNFTIQSDSYGTGSIGKIPLNASRPNSFDGLFTVERYLSAKRAYRLIASPVYAATSGSNKVYSLNYVQNSAYITGTNAAGGFDKVTSGPTLYLYREDVGYSNTTFISGNYQSINNLTAGNNATPTYKFDVTAGSYSIPVSNGFLFFFRGNNADGTVAQETVTSWPATAVTMSTTGSLTQQQVVFRDWYTPGSNLLGYSNPNVMAQGFNMAGNPYACSIDWETSQNASTTTGIYALNLSPYIYELNPQTGNFDTYGKGGLSTNNGTRTIMSGQGFFVLALNGSGQLIFNEGAKSTTLQNTGMNLFMGQPADVLANNQSLRLQILKDTINKDDIVISFNANAKPALDMTEDAPYKMGSGKVNIATMSSDNYPLAVNKLPLAKQGQTIAMRVGASTSGTYKLNMTEIKGIPKLYDVWLQDHLRKDSNDMRVNTSYIFDVDKTDTNTYGTNRFSIVIRQNPAYAYRLLDFNANKIANTKQVQVVWDTKYEENYTNFTVERSVDGGKTFDVLGGVPATGAGNYGFVDKSPASGMNLYRLKQEDINNNITYSKIVPIGYSAMSNNLAKGGISVYPNPLSSKINLSIATPVTPASSSYNIMISNSYGTMLKSVTSTQPTWQGDVSSWLPGTYMVKVFDTKTQSLVGTTKFIKL